MKPTICFVIPPSPFLMDERVFPTLGVLKVAAVVKECGYPVHVIDLNGVSNFEDVLNRYLINHGATVFALTATTPQMPHAYRIAKLLRERIPYCWLILGGPHPTLVYASLKHTERGTAEAIRLGDNFNIIVRGDGEYAIVTALTLTDIVNTPTSPATVIDADDPKSRAFLTNSQLNTLPFAARSLIDLYSYKFAIEGIDATPLVAQLGCPFGCTFCAGRNSPMLRRVRLRSTESIISELYHLYVGYGYRGFMFFDDELNVNRNFIELLQEMVKLQDRLGIQLRCRGFVKAELFTAEQAEWMYRAGFRKILCGFESGSELILTNIRKQATRDDNTRAMELSHKYGLGMKALMSIGHPGESDATAAETMEWIREVRPEDFDVTIITTYPGSPYYDNSQWLRSPSLCWQYEAANGDKLYSADVDYEQEADYYKGMPGNYKSYVWTDMLSPEDIVVLRDAIELNVRSELKIPYPRTSVPLPFESSYGSIPRHILRSGE